MTEYRERRNAGPVKWFLPEIRGHFASFAKSEANVADFDAAALGRDQRRMC
jgi:hypothetical protein